MANDCTMLEVSGVGVGEEDDEIELSLELSIGGSYGASEKSKPTEQKSMNSCNGIDTNLGEKYQSFSRSASVSQIFVGDVQLECPLMDPQAKREIQALRRQEARKKREEKLKQGICRGMKMNGGFLVANGFADDKLWLETQQFQSRVRDRENDDGVVLEPARKKEKIGECVVNVVDKEIKGLNLTLNHNGAVIKNQGSDAMVYTSSPPIPTVPVQYPYPPLQYVPFTNGVVYPYVMPCWASTSGNEEEEKEKENEKNVSQTVARRSFRAYQGSRQNRGTHDLLTDCDSEHNTRSSKDDGGNRKSVSNERSSSAVSGYRSTSPQKGGSRSDSGSHSSWYSQPEQPLNASAANDPPEQSEHSGLSNQQESDQAIDKVANHTVTVASTQSSPIKPLEPTPTESDTQPDPVNEPISTTQNPTPTSLKETKVVMGKPQTQNHDIPALMHMPCVSTTGNGPNGKTISGFLYRYTKTEVSIVCVCHGSSFSPAEFVEHAGGVDISHPLRHITVVPSAFG